MGTEADAPTLEGPAERWEALAAGTLVAVGLLLLMAVGMRPAEAVEGESAFNVTNNTTYDYSPDYSPGGDRIAFRGVAPRDIYTINVHGMGRFNVTADSKAERDPSYSPDGQKIAYSGYDGQDWEIYIINADGGGRTQLTDNATDEQELSWSPDGQKIAYEGYDGHDKEIYTVGLGPASRAVQVTHNTTYDTDPSFSPSGQRIAYAGDDGHDTEIWTIGLGPASRVVRVTNNTTWETELSWSPDGQKIAYKGREIAYVDSRYVRRDTEIYTVGLGSARTVNQVTYNSAANDGEPSWSPDGQKMAYEGKDVPDKEIFTVLIPPSPPNDNYASARVLSGRSASAGGTNAGATLQRGDPRLVDSETTRHTVWYRWTAPFSGAVEVNTCTTDFDTLMGVYTGNAPGGLRKVAANDDGCATGSKVRFNATKNATYRMLVDGFNGKQGAFTLRVIDKRS
jgi:Tol biopolymer transport system component